jgi:hypothetical protein
MKKIIIKFQYKALESFKSSLDLGRAFSATFKLNDGRTAMLVKHDEFSKVEIEIENDLIAIADKKFEFNQNFETDALFLNYFDVDGTLSEVVPFLVTNGQSILIWSDGKSFNVECVIDKHQFDLQVVRLDSMNNKTELASISVDSEEDEKTIFIN